MAAETAGTTPPELLSNRLTALAEDVKTEADALAAAERSAAEHALNAGRLLCEAKDACRHGEWLPFLARAGVPERSAQRWMKLHRSGLKNDIVSDLGGVVAALHFLSLRAAAAQHFDAAEAAAIHYKATGEGEAGLVDPIVKAMDAIDAMVAMFPPEQAAEWYAGSECRSETPRELGTRRQWAETINAGWVELVESLHRPASRGGAQ